MSDALTVFHWSETYGMGHLSKTELNLTQFYTNPNFSLALCKYIAEMNQKQLEFLKENNFWWGYVGNKYSAPEDPIYLYLVEWAYVHTYDVIKRVRTRHHIRRFLRISLILIIHPNTGQTPGTTAEGKKTNMNNSEGRSLLTVETLKNFYFCIERLHNLGRNQPILLLNSR